MYYGHAPRRGRRRPAYEWVPSFFPSRHRRKRQPLPTGFGPTSRRSRANPHRLRPRKPLSPPYDPFSDSIRHPTLSLVPDSIGEGLAEMFAGAALTAVWLFWEYFLAAGLVILVLRYLTRHLRKQEKRWTCKCEQEYRVHNINRKFSVNPPPTAAALEAAWAATRGGRRGDPAVLAARLRLGSMLSDLEPVVDQSYIRDETGAIVGRQPGLRGWIGFYTPSLMPHYKSLMAYKALADKLRVALNIEEPDTLDSVLEIGNYTEKELSKNSKNTGENAVDQGLVEAVQEAVGVSSKRQAEDWSRQANNKMNERPNERLNERPKETEKSSKNSDEAPWSEAKKKDIPSNSMQLKQNINVLQSNVEQVRKAYHAMFGAGMPESMAALEAVVRERLGLAWMRRGRRKSEQSEQVA